jgi:hypothetical protein
VGVVIAHARELIRDLRQLDVHQKVRNGELCVEDPAHRLTAGLRQKIEFFKGELVELLWSEPDDTPPAVASLAVESTGDRTVARFPGNIEVELARDGGSRWLMFETRWGKRTRRKGFATPFLDHGRRTAEHWYGPPINGWHATADLRKDLDRPAAGAVKRSARRPADEPYNGFSPDAVTEKESTA